jgi:hypothetical protein
MHHRVEDASMDLHAPFLEVEHHAWRLFLHVGARAKGQAGVISVFRVAEGELVALGVGSPARHLKVNSSA